MVDRVDVVVVQNPINLGVVRNFQEAIGRTLDWFEVQPEIFEQEHQP